MPLTRNYIEIWGMGICAIFRSRDLLKKVILENFYKEQCDVSKNSQN